MLRPPEYMLQTIDFRMGWMYGQIDRCLDVIAGGGRSIRMFRYRRSHDFSPECFAPTVGCGIWVDAGTLDSGFRHRHAIVEDFPGCTVGYFHKRDRCG